MRLLIDCDPGIDDMVALLLACASPEAELLGVTTVGGNTGLTATTRNARAVLDLAGRPDVPVAAGAGRPLVRADVRGATEIHGGDGLGGLGLTATTPVDPRHAVDLAAQAVAGSTQPVTLVATGPLTNVALLYARYPEIAARLDRLVVMGGSIGAGNTTPAAEFNVWYDPEAAYRVLSEPMTPTLMVGLDLTYRTLVEPGDLDRLRGAGRIGGYAARALEYYQSRYAHRLGRRASPVHDAVALAAALRPELFTTVPATIVVDTGYGPSRGNTVVDRYAAEPNAAVATDADIPAVVGLIVDRVAGLG